MSAIVRETSEYVEMSDSITLCIVKDGAAGKDATVYGVQVSSYSEWISSGNKLQGLQFGFTKTTGTTVEKYTDVTKMGCTVKIYGDDTLYDNVSEWINKGNANFLFSSFPYNNVVGNPTLGDASVVCVELYLDGMLVATANYANGKQGADGKGALEIICNPETIVLDTDDNGLVNDTSNAWAALMCLRDGKEVSDVTYKKGLCMNCGATVGTDTGVVTITSVRKQSVTVDGQTVEVSCTSGSVTVNVTDLTTKTTYVKTIPFAVNVAKFNGGLAADNKRFETTYNYLTNNGTSTDFSYYESHIKQTAKEISLKVSEKSVGRRNMLPGSAFRKGDDGFEMGIYGDFDGSTYTKGYHGNQGIFMNGGVSGSNFFRAKSYYNGSNQQYGGLFWRGGGASKNIKVQANKKYALSCWVKCDRTDVTIALETIYKASETTTTRQGRPFTTPNNFHVSKANTWQLISCIVTTDGSFNYLEVNFWVSHMINGVTATACFCHPMFEEAEEYNGWTLSELDYDYIGGNLIDNSRTFASGGNCNVLTIYGSVIANVYNSESSVFKARMEALAGSVPSKYSLPSSASSGTRYALDSDWSVWQYNGNSLSDDSHYNGWQKTNESLHQDIMLVNLNLELNKDYIISWYAKCEGNGFFGAYATDVGKTVYSEYSDGGIDQSTYGENIFFLTTQWKRFWMHVKLIKGSCSAIAFRQYRGDWSSGSSAMTVYFTQPKIEEGATVTDWTEKRSDMVDKQALYATGIDIDSKKITLTANHTYVRTNDGTPTVMIDADGNLTNVKVNADMVNVSATHQLRISGNGAMVVDMDNFKLDESGNASFKGSIDSKSGTISFFTFTDSGMYSASSSLQWGLGLRSTNISVRGTPGGRVSLVCLGDGHKDTTLSGDTDTYPTSLVNGQKVNYCNLIQVTAMGGGTGNGRDAAALGIETNGDYCLSAMGGLSHLQGLALDASMTSGSANRTLFLCSGGSFTMPSNPKDGQLVIVIQTTSSGITFYDGGKNFMKGESTSSTAKSGSAGQWNFFVYDAWKSSWRCVYANGGLF